MNTMQRVVSRTLLACLVTLVATTTATAAEPELRGTPADLQRFLRSGAHTVTLSGHARQSMQSDIGHVTVIVHTQAKDLATALSTNADRREALSRTLQQQGFDAKSIRAEKFSSSPQYGWFGKTPTSYEVNNRLTIDISDDRQLIQIAQAAAQSPDYSVGATRFEYSKQAELQEAVRHQALDDALAKKSFYEQRLGAALHPVEFQFSDQSARGERRNMMLEEIVVTGSRAGDSYAPANLPPPPVPAFDEQVYEVSVAVTFDVEPAKAGERP